MVDVIVAKWSGRDIQGDTGFFECGALCEEEPRTRGRKAIWRDPHFIGRRRRSGLGLPHPIVRIS